MIPPKYVEELKNEPNERADFPATFIEVRPLDNRLDTGLAVLSIRLIGIDVCRGIYNHRNGANASSTHHQESIESVSV